MKTKLIRFLLIFVSFPSIVHLESTASLASRIEIFREFEIIYWFFKYNFNRIRLFYNFLIFIFYHFNHIKVKEHFYGLLRIHFVKSKYYSSIPYLFECIYIAYNVSSRVYVIVYFFWSIAYNLLEARNISYDISLPRNWIRVQNMFRLVERIPSPSCYSMREIEAQRDIVRRFFVTIKRLKFSRDICSIYCMVF